MKRSQRLAGIVLALLAPAALADPPEVSPTDKAHIAAMIAASPGADGVFKLREDGAVVHVQSGIACPGKLGAAELYQLLIFSNPPHAGEDIGCDYGRPNGAGSMAAKHTLYLVKASEGMTLESAFARYQKEFHNSYPGLKPAGEALKFGNQLGPDFPQIRSEEMFFTANTGRKMQTSLIVSMVNGWIIEVRSDRGSQYAAVTPDDATDQIASLQLFFGAVAGLGGPNLSLNIQLQPITGKQ